MTYFDVLRELLLAEGVPLDEFLLTTVAVLVEIEQFGLVLLAGEFVAHPADETCMGVS